MSDATHYLQALSPGPQGRLTANIDLFDEELLGQHLREHRIVTVGPVGREASSRVLAQITGDVVRCLARPTPNQSVRWVMLVLEPGVTRLQHRDLHVSAEQSTFKKLLRLLKPVLSSASKSAALIPSDVFDFMESRHLEAFLAEAISGSAPTVISSTSAEAGNEALAAANRERLMAARREMLEQVGAYSSKEIATLRESATNNVSQLGGDLRKAGKIFGVRHGAAWHYPKFQFDAAGKPFPEVAAVLRGLGDKALPWDILGWFTCPNEHLGGQTPLEKWPSDRPAVVAAAEMAHWFARD